MTDGGAVVERDFTAPRMRLTVRDGPLAVPVLVSATGTFAARSELPVDRLHDVADIVEGLAAALPGPQLELEARIDRVSGGLELPVCGLPPGAARSVLSDVRHGGLARLLAVTADAIAVRSTSRSGEVLVVSLLPPR